MYAYAARVFQLLTVDLPRRDHEKWVGDKCIKVWHALTMTIKDCAH